MIVPREFALVAACCRWPVSPERDAAVRAAAAGPIDWDAFERVLAKQRVAALVHDGLRRAGVAVPAAVAGRIAARAAGAGRTALAMARETLRLQKAFDAAGLPVLFVKGTSVALLAYGELGVKQSWDIDLLTTPEAALAGRHLLEGLGYQLIEPAGLDDAHFLRLVSFSKECVFFHAGLGMSVELHWRLVDNPMLLAGIGADAPTQDVALGGAAVRTLADAPLFAYLCAHGTAHGWVRLKWLADVAAFLARRDAGEVERLHRAAIDLGAGRTTGIALLLCHRLLGLTLAPALLAELEGDRMTARLADNALRCMTHDGGAAELTAYCLPALRIQLSHLALVPGGRYLRHELALKWRSPIDRTELALPKSLEFLYPVLRLPLWAWRVGGRALGKKAA